MRDITAPRGELPPTPSPTTITMTARSIEAWSWMRLGPSSPPSASHAGGLGWNLRPDRFERYMIYSAVWKIFTERWMDVPIQITQLRHQKPANISADRASTSSPNWTRKNRLISSSPMLAVCLSWSCTGIFVFLSFEPTAESVNT